MTKQEIRKSIEDIQQLVIDGETLEAVEALISFVKKLKNDAYNVTAVTISGYKKEILNLEMNALLSSSELAVKKNTVNKQILLLLNQIEDEQIEGKKTLDTSKLASSQKKGMNRLFPIIGVLLGIVLLYFVVFRGSGKTAGTSPCDNNLNAAKALFEKGDYSTARVAFLEIKLDEACSNKHVVADEYIDLCNEKSGDEGFKLLKIQINASPQEHQGSCPIDVMFSGKIFTNQKSGTIQYCLDFNGGNGTNCLPVQLQSGVANFNRSYQFTADELKKLGSEINVSMMVIDESKIAHKGGKVTLEYVCSEN